MTCDYCRHESDTEVAMRQLGRNGSGRWIVACIDTVACDKRDAERERRDRRALEPETD